MGYLTQDDFEQIGAFVTKLLNERQMPIAKDGVILSGSWDPKTGSVQVILADTATMFPDTPDSQIYHPRVPLLTPHYGEQYAPVGNERVKLIQTQSGPAAIMHYDEDDSPGAPAGEKWTTHRNSSGVVDTYTHYTNDGPTANDGLGGLHHNGGALTKITTTGGHSYTQNDTSKQVVDSTAGGNKTVKDDNTNEVSHVTQHIGLGDLFANLNASDAAIANTHLTTFENSLQSQRITDSHNSITALCTALASASPPVTLSASTVIALLATFAHVSVPAGSGGVRLKP